MTTPSTVSSYYSGGSCAPLEEYSYSELVDKEKDIRLLDLLPGDFDDPVKITIRHARLIPGDSQPWNAGLWTREQLEETLPPNWRVRETRDDRYLFVCYGITKLNPPLLGIIHTSWTHPKKSISQSKYQVPNGSEPFEPYYEALSYTWGSVDNRATVLVEQSAISVRQNLFQALKHLRMPDKTRTLWVDALCINQRDESERNEQVKRMVDIYKKASRVVVWLGLERENSKGVLRKLEYLGKQIQFDNSSFYPDPEAEEKSWYRWSAQLPIRADMWSSIDMFLCRSWFSRQWIIQEIQLGNQRSILQCGRDQISWTAFRTATTYLYYNEHRPDYLDKNISRLSSLSVNYRLKPFSWLVGLTSLSSCTEPRDKIYGLLGLIPKTLAQQIQPRYSHSVPDVFKDAFLANTWFCHRLDLFLLCELASRQIDGPSWIPDLTACRLARAALSNQFSSGFSRAHVEYQKPNILSVEGVSHAAISSVSQAYRDGNGDLASVGAFLREWLSQEAAGETNIDNAEQIVRTLCINRLSERWESEQDPSLEAWKGCLLSDGTIAKEGQIRQRLQAIIRPRRPRDRQEYFSHFMERPFFKLQSGEIGIGPPGAQKGDIVCVFLGSDLPMLLRPNPDNKFKVVGTCFISSLCDLMGILGPLPDRWAIQYRYSANTQIRCHYVDTSTGERTFSDPRLGPLVGWEIQDDQVSQAEDSMLVATFQNCETGEVTNSDPRLQSEALKCRGVDIRSFDLI